MNLQIGERRSPTFAEPIELLVDCHRRVERFLAILLQVTEEAEGGPLNRLQREGLEAGLRYFAEAAPKHTADEEESLFPRLRRCGAAAEEVLARVADLESDHAGAAPAHAAVDVLGRRWLARGILEREEVLELRNHLSTLTAMYQRHIAAEESEVFPLAARLLPAEEIAGVGREMASRRGQAHRFPSAPTAPRS